MTDGWIERTAAVALDRLRKGFPVVGITGPRQAGKTTLARMAFPNKPYVSLEDPDQLDFAQTDPRGFLDRFPDGAVFDEVQRVPELFAWLQGIVDRHQVMGEFILTGSQQFGFRQHAAQSLAGRMGLLHLLPFSCAELRAHGFLPPGLDEAMFRGFYPPVHVRPVSPSDWYAGYVQTYVERDVRQVLRVKDVARFRLALRLCAGRVGQLFNASALGNEVGVSHNTMQEWLSVFEAGYIVFRLSPHHRNFSKRLIKTPKLYFFDTGLLCWLLGIRTAEQLSVHPLRGAIFENYVISELARQYYARGEEPPLFFWRDRAGLEVDLLIETSEGLKPVEIKSGKTVTGNFFRGLKAWMRLAGDSACAPALVFGGEEYFRRDGVEVCGWREPGRVLAGVAGFTAG